jgi:hypothetical protein
LTTHGPTGSSIALLLVQDSWRWLREAVEQRCGLLPPSRRDEALGELAKAVLAVLHSTALIGATDIRDVAVSFLCKQNDDVLACLIQVLRKAKALSSTTLTAAGLDVIARHCCERLEARLARRARAADDWSIEPPGGCGCELCDVLGGFLADPARRIFEWPLAKEKRRHVHDRVDRAEVPVRHQTRRTGSPYTLVLTKTEEIFERERRGRHRDEAALRRLHDDWATGRRSHRRR